MAFDADDGQRIFDWPEQTIPNGVAKNDRCNRYYKRMVRIVKQLCCEMRESGIKDADGIGSFFIECLVYNVPDQGFAHNTLSEDWAYVLSYIYESTNSEPNPRWTEVNGVKYLFHPTQSWTVEMAHSFANAAIGYVGA